MSLITKAVLQRGWLAQQLNRPRLAAFLALTNLHPYALAFCQRSQSIAFKRGRVDKDILAAVVGPYEAEPLLGIVPLHRSGTLVDRPVDRPPLRGWARRDIQLRRARGLG